jgi:hypothetical protein
MAPAYDFSDSIIDLEHNFTVIRPDEYLPSLKGKSDASILAYIDEEPQKFFKALENSRDLVAALEWIANIYERRRNESEAPARGIPAARNVKKRVAPQVGWGLPFKFATLCRELVCLLSLCFCTCSGCPSVGLHEHVQSRK